MANKYLGEFEQVVLLTIVRLEKSAYGGNIRTAISELINRDITIGALYITLERLEKKGFVTSALGESSSSRGGRPRRYFDITGQGKEELKRSREVLNTLWDGVNLRASSTNQLSL